MEQGICVVSQEYGGIKPQATRQICQFKDRYLACRYQRSLPKEPINCPRGHQTESIVKRFPDANGRNSRKRAPSTGRFPPTPNPRAENRAHVPIQLGAPPTAIPKTPQMKRLQLKAGLRPIISEATPQKDAPQQRPTKRAQVVYRTVLASTPNSGVS